MTGGHAELSGESFVLDISFSLVMLSNITAKIGMMVPKSVLGAV